MIRFVFVYHIFSCIERRGRGQIFRGLSQGVDFAKLSEFWRPPVSITHRRSPPPTFDNQPLLGLLRDLQLQEPTSFDLTTLHNNAAAKILKLSDFR